MNETEFFELVLKEFPHLEKEMNEWEKEYFHMRMEVFAEYAIELIKTNNIPELINCFNFIEHKIDIINSDLKNILNVSYCESLLLGDVAHEMDRIINLMPIKLKTLYLDYKQYYYNLAKN